MEKRLAKDDPCSDGMLPSCASKFAALEVKLIDLHGNHKPGRVSELEKVVNQHSRLIWVGIGGLWIFQILFASHLIDLSRILNHP